MGHVRITYSNAIIPHSSILFLDTVLESIKYIAVLLKSMDKLGSFWRLLWLGRGVLVINERTGGCESLLHAQSRPVTGLRIEYPL